MKGEFTLIHNVTLRYLDDPCGCVAGQIIIPITIGIIHLQVSSDPWTELSQFGLELFCKVATIDPVF